MIKGVQKHTKSLIKGVQIGVEFIKTLLPFMDMAVLELTFKPTTMQILVSYFKR